MQVVEQEEIPIKTELQILTKNQKKKLKKRESKMKKKQASAQAGDESGSSQPMNSIPQIMTKVTCSF